MPTVLVIDDDLDIVDSIRDVLEDEGYTVIAATDGEEALVRLASVKPELILLDLAMPHMDGGTFREAQRRNPALAGIPTVVMSAADRTREKAAPLMPDDCLVKPIRLATLLEVVNKYCRKGP
jgi:CheY-like chemotaxis protein